MLSKKKRVSTLLAWMLPIFIGCAEDTGDTVGLSSETGGDGDGDGDGTGDGDGDGTGDGDGDGTGDGDGDGTGTGTGDSDGTGTSDSDGTGTGDSDGTGDGDDVCGDGIISGSEACDDGNIDDIDDCLSTCEIASCGDGFVWAGNEDCDDGNDIDNDGCDGGCTITPGIKKVITGWGHTCALSWTGEVKCWGSGGLGRLGQGNNNDVLSPLDIDPVSTGDLLVVDVVAGYYHTCALYEDQTVRCWGMGTDGRLGQGNLQALGDDEFPNSIPAIDLGGDVIKIEAGASTTCAVLSGGAVRCWGDALYGLGYGNTNDIGDDELPSAVGVINVGGTVVDISMGTLHTCVLTDQDEVRCWGANDFGQLGYGNTTYIGDNEVPAQVGFVQTGNVTVVQIEAGGLHTCARYDDDTIRCWGANSYGQLGYGNITNIGDNELPNSIGTVDVGGSVHDVMCKWDETCALLDGGDVRCWGRGHSGQLGQGNLNDIGDNELPSSMPVIQVGADVAAFFQHSSQRHVCVLTTANNIRCWGDGENGNLGYGGQTDIGDNDVPSFYGDVPY